MIEMSYPVNRAALPAQRNRSPINAPKEQNAPRRLPGKTLPVIRRPFDTVPRRTAPEWFAYLRPLVQEFRPKLGDRVHPRYLDRKGKPLRIPIYGKPTFQNILDQHGAHV